MGKVISRCGARGAREKTAILAVEALDDLVYKLVTESQLHAPKHFLDWVMNEATVRVQTRAERLASGLNTGDAAPLQSTVRQWVQECMAAEIQARLQGTSVDIEIE